ncbi:hypothetical protein PO909_028572, partial [Leuciscus waleckii]
YIHVYKISLLCSPRLHLFDQKYIKTVKIVQYYKKKMYNCFICEYILRCNLFL